MGSAGLANAVTNNWTTIYGDEIRQSLEESPMLSIAGIHHRIKEALSTRSARACLLKIGSNWKEVRRGI